MKNLILTLTLLIVFTSVGQVNVNLFDSKDSLLIAEVVPSVHVWFDASQSSDGVIVVDHLDDQGEHLFADIYFLLSPPNVSSYAVFHKRLGTVTIFIQEAFDIIWFELSNGQKISYSGPGLTY